MRKAILLQLMGPILGIIALMMVPALIMAVALGESAMIRAFVLPLGLALAIALPLTVIVLRSMRKQPFRPRTRDGFLLVCMIWGLVSLVGAVPYCLSPQGLSFTDALLESTGAFATTGVTTIADIEVLPRSLLLWRGLSYWFGGIGIILLTVALLPLLGVGGFQLIKAEASGSEMEKITPKITATAKLLWLVYSMLTVLLTLLYLLGGMDWFDALCHAFGVVASGGVSTKNAGIAYFESPFIDIVTTVFMLLAALNFNLYYRLLQGKFREILYNTEVRAFFLIFFAAAAVITVSLVPVYGSVPAALRRASYQAASILSTTGSAIADYELWPSLAKAVLFGLMFIGGCSSSSAGGIKVIRHVVLFKQAGNELRRLIFPRGIFSVQLNGKVGRKDVVYGVAGFIFLYFMVVAFTTLVVASSGTDLYSSFSAALSITGNLGIGFGAVGPSHNYGAFPDYVKWVLSFVMIAGRLELWTVFALAVRPN